VHRLIALSSSDSVNLIRESDIVAVYLVRVDAHYRTYSTSLILDSSFSKSQDDDMLTVSFVHLPDLLSIATKFHYIIVKLG
jgi:hypothetical protein